MHRLRVWQSYLHIPVGNTFLSTLCWVHFIGNLTRTKISLLGISGLTIQWPQSSAMKQKEFRRVSHPLFTRNKNLVHWLLWSEHDYGNYKLWCVMESLWAPWGTLETWSHPTDVPVMSLPIRYSPMAFYFQLSIIFFTLQILRQAPHWCNRPWPLCIHHWLYPITIAPLARYNVRDLPYDLWTTSLHFPFLVSSLLPNTSFHGLTDHRLSHRTIRTLPYVSPHTSLVLISLIICI